MYTPLSEGSTPVRYKLPDPESCERLGGRYPSSFDQDIVIL